MHCNMLNLLLTLCLALEVERARLFLPLGTLLTFIPPASMTSAFDDVSAR